MTNRNKNVLLGLGYILIFGALVYFIFLRKGSKSCKSSADCLKGGYGMVCKDGKCVPLGPDKFGFGVSTFKCSDKGRCAGRNCKCMKPDCKALVFQMQSIFIGPEGGSSGKYTIPMNGLWVNNKIMPMMKKYSDMGYKFAVTHFGNIDGQDLQTLRDILDTIGYQFTDFFHHMVFSHVVVVPTFESPAPDRDYVIDAVKCYYRIKNRNNVIIGPCDMVGGC